MKNVYVLTLMGLAFISIPAQNFNWAKREGLWAYDYGYGITTDNNGNVYVAGKYEMFADFSGTILPCEGNHDIYLAQYSASGNLNWITTAGGNMGDYATSVACDNNYVYIGGEIEGWGTTVYFEGSNVTLNAEGFNDIILAKYDLSGNLIWAKRAGGSENEKALGITYDNSGNVYICGFFRDVATFETTTINGYGTNDIFLAKYDANGNFLWVRNAGSSGRDEAKSVRCDAAGNVYICGMYEDGCVFGSQTLTSANTYFDCFLAKYDGNGNLQWVRTGGSDYDEVAWQLEIDNAGKIYIAGEFNAYAIFDSYAITTSGEADIFVACYDASGNIQWITPVGGDLVDRARGLGCDGTNLYITGQYGGTVTFGPSSITAVDSSDVFIASLTNTGSFIWATTVGGQADSLEPLGYESGNAICARSDGSVYATGAILDGGVFGSIAYNEYDRTDVFVCKITALGVGGAEITLPGAISVYPNPSSGTFSVSGLDQDMDVKVYGSIGNLVYSSRAVAREHSFDLPAGVYFIEVHDGEQSLLREKIIIQ
ncbi:MAG: T9SS type A sorting domain-containing protein [Bacteroidota bacterium]